MNSSGTCRLKAHQHPVTTHMRVYDQLPAELRRALAEARSNFCPLCVRDAWRRYGTELAVQLMVESESGATA
jgi:Family of unknown function (DUF6525)